MKDLIKKYLIEMAQKSNTLDFINKARKIHGDKYSYNNVDYVKSSDKVSITCPIHGDFLQTPNKHLLGRGCRECSYSEKQTKFQKGTDKFIQDAKSIHGDKYDYTLVKYINNRTTVDIICPIHGIVPQNPYEHLKYTGCKFCGDVKMANSKASTKDEFIKKANEVHNNKYDYSDVIYKNNTTPVIIKCKSNNHGEFLQSPTNHLMGQGCPICSESKGVKLITNILSKNNIVYVREKKFDDCVNTIKGKYCRKLPFDLYLPDYNSIIEYDGIQHFQPVKHFGGDKSFNRTKLYDKIKNDFCYKKGIKIIRIPYTVKTSEIEDLIIKELNK